MKKEISLLELLENERKYVNNINNTIETIEYIEKNFENGDFFKYEKELLKNKLKLRAVRNELKKYLKNYI